MRIINKFYLKIINQVVFATVKVNAKSSNGDAEILPTSKTCTPLKAKRTSEGHSLRNPYKSKTKCFLI